MRNQQPNQTAICLTLLHQFEFQNDCECYDLGKHERVFQVREYESLLDSALFFSIQERSRSVQECYACVYLNTSALERCLSKTIQIKVKIS